MSHSRPNPPAVILSGLSDSSVRQVVRLALLVVADLAAGKEWDALEKYQFSHMDAEHKIAFWSLLDSSQRSWLKDLTELAK